MPWVRLAFGLWHCFTTMTPWPPVSQRKKVMLKTSINHVAFVFFRHQQHGFCFVPMSTTYLSKVTTAGKARRGCVTIEEVAWIFTRQSHINQVSTISEWVTRQGNYRTWVRYKSYLTAKPRHLTTLWFWVDLDLWCVCFAHLCLSISYNGWRITFFCVALTLTHFFVNSYSYIRKK